MSTVIDKEKELTNIISLIKNDPLCSGLRKEANQLVFGSGNIDADIIFIGEAPGKKEDQEGQPFIGAAGKFLDKMLESIGLDRASVYITNIVKYRPPQNRDPLPQEKEAFLPYLIMQILSIKPKLLVTLGRHAASVFIPNIKIGYEHGIVKNKRIELNKAKLDLLLLPLYHPAAALYNGSKRQVLFDDFSLIPSILSNKGIK